MELDVQCESSCPNHPFLIPHCFVNGEACRRNERSPRHVERVTLLPRHSNNEAFRASILFGRLMDVNYKRVAKNAGFRIDIKRGDDMRNFPLEHARIQVFIIPLYVGIAAILCWGWVLERNAPLAAPLVLSFIIGLCLTGSFNVMSTMLVDLYPLSPATATAANNLVRCLMGAAGTAVIIQMIDGMGRGWCFTFIAAVIFFTSPLLWAEMKWGPKWREQRRVRIEKREEEKEARKAEAETSQGDVN